MIVDIFYYVPIGCMVCLFIYGIAVILIDGISVFWPKVNVTVLSLSATEKYGDPKSKERFYGLDVEYQYVYNGVTYRSTRLNSLGSVVHSKRNKIEFYSKCVSSLDVSARVFPLFPAFALLLPGSYNKVFVFSITAISILFLTIVWVQV